MIVILFGVIGIWAGLALKGLALGAVLKVLEYIFRLLSQVMVAVLGPVADAIGYLDRFLAGK
jgi:hypothetical protein